MPRGPRLDAPGALHHVMVRGIERRPLFHDDTDRADFVARLAEVVRRTGLILLAWALLPNHLHLLVRTPPAPSGRPYRPVLPAAMRRLLTGYAGAFNRRHKRVGHLVQNRYRSTLVEEDSYLLELVRYLHLNPLRAGVVSDLAALQRIPGADTPRSLANRPTVAGRARRGWHSSAQASPRRAGGTGILLRPGRPGDAGRSSRGADCGGVPAAGVKWRRSGWTRGLGGRMSAFSVRGPLSGGPVRSSRAAQRLLAAPAGPRGAVRGLSAMCADLLGVELSELQHGTRRRRVVQARAVVATLAVVIWGCPAAPR